MRDTFFYVYYEILLIYSVEASAPATAVAPHIAAAFDRYAATWVYCSSGFNPLKPRRVSPAQAATTQHKPTPPKPCKLPLMEAWHNTLNPAGLEYRVGGR